jgi:hypothetical protein
MLNTNNIITFSFLIGLLIITLSFVWYKRKALLMLRALFSTRYFQQLLREGKIANEQIFFYTILIYLVAFPCIILSFFHFYFPELYAGYSPVKLYMILCAGILVAIIVSQFFLWYFAEIFNYQEQRYLYTTTKALYRFYNALFLVCIIPVVWFTRTPELIFFIYIPFLILILIAFFARFVKNISGVSLIHFFIYFCSLEILPYLLLIKLFANIYN